MLHMARKHRGYPCRTVSLLTPSVIPHTEGVLYGSCYTQLFCTAGRQCALVTNPMHRVSNHWLSPMRLLASRPTPGKLIVNIGGLSHFVEIIWQV